MEILIIFIFVFPSSSLPNAMITLFQLFTLDQWYKVYNDLVKVVGPAFTCTYILLWVWIGSFVFRNLFVGIMGRFRYCHVNLSLQQGYTYYRRSGFNCVV